MVHGAADYESGEKAAEAGDTSGRGGAAWTHVHTVDLSEIVHHVHRNLVRRNGGQRGASKLLMKLDIEGSEYAVLTHL
eukprot:7346298-Prymnesium_polylepis.1